MPEVPLVPLLPPPVPPVEDGLAPPVVGPLAPLLPAPPDEVALDPEALDTPLTAEDEVVVVVVGVAVVGTVAFADAPPGTVSDPCGGVPAAFEPPPPQPARAAAAARQAAVKAT